MKNTSNFGVLVTLNVSHRKRSLWLDAHGSDQLLLRLKSIEK